MSAQRGASLRAGVLTRDAMALVSDPNIDLVVEVIGGIEPARELITTALRHRKPVVTDEQIERELAAMRELQSRVKPGPGWRQLRDQGRE